MSLPLPNFCSIQLVDDVVAERQNGVNAAYFQGVGRDWRERVRAYVESGGSPQTVTRWPEIESRKNSFLNLYLSPSAGSAQGLMLDALNSHDLNLCPACGEAGRPNTLDHYLPKGKYPHLCITPHNLFPMCDACQKAKLEKTGDAVSPKFFVHPYFDVFVANQVVALEISPPFETPTFSLRPSAGLSASEHELIVSHLRELNIQVRYPHFFREQHRRLLRLVNVTRIAGRDVRANLSLFQFNCALPSHNSWEHVFYSSVLNNDDMMDYLQNAVLPNYL